MRKYLIGVLSLCLMLVTLESCTNSKRSSRDFTKNRSSKSSQKRSTRPYNSPKKTSPKVAQKSKPSTSKAIAKNKSKKQSSKRRVVKSELVERNRIVEFALRYKGLPYQYGGKTPESGFDCSGLVYYTYRHFNYGMVAGSANQAKLGKRIAAKNAIPGDLLFFGNSKRVSHVGIVSYNDGKSLKMVHSSSSRGVIEEDIHASTYWKSRFLYARTVIGSLGSSGRASIRP